MWGPGTSVRRRFRAALAMLTRTIKWSWLKAWGKSASAVEVSLMNRPTASAIPLLAALLDIPLPAERASALPPEELRRRQLVALIAWVSAGARVQPVVLALEDVHWADPTTLDVLRGIAERGALVPLFVLITARPEFRPPWGIRSHHGMILLTLVALEAG
jgi:hypothetical protein